MTPVVDTKPVVLVVDDYPVNSLAVESALSDLAVRFLYADSGAQALRLLDEAPAPIALAVLDVRMTGMDGGQLAVELRKHANGQHTPIIFVSSGPRAESSVAGLVMESTDYLQKPFNIELLLSMATDAIDHFLRAIPWQGRGSEA